MQCGNCGFENMPGNTGCARCGSPLGAATLVIDVHPPRARDFSGRMRRVAALRMLPVRLVRWLQSFNDRALAAGAMRVQADGTAAPLLWRALIPGWAQFYGGQLWQGYFFLFSYILLLSLAVLRWGTDLGSLMLVSAFVVHQTSFLDIFHQYSPDESLSARFRRNWGGMAALGFFLYLPPYIFLSGVAQPVAIQQSIGAFAAGDVLLMNHWQPVRPGDLVMFTTSGALFGTGGQIGREYIELQERETGIDRLLAVGGDQILWKNGILSVNGQISRWLPLNPATLPGQMFFTVPDGTYLVFPSLSPRAGLRSVDAWQTISCMPAGNISGHVYFRWGPPSRFGRID